MVFFFPIFFFKFFCTNIFRIPQPPTLNCTQSPPHRSEPFCIYSLRRAGLGWRGGGLPSGRVGAGRWRRRVQMVRVAPLGVRGRRAALAVLLGRQILAPGRGRRRHRLRVVVEVAGVALGRGRGPPPARAVVAVAHVRAARRGGRREVPVAVGPVAAKKNKKNK